MSKNHTDTITLKNVSKVDFLARFSPVGEKEVLKPGKEIEANADTAKDLLKMYPKSLKVTARNIQENEDLVTPEKALELAEEAVEKAVATRGAELHNETLTRLLSQLSPADGETEAATVKKTEVVAVITQILSEVFVEYIEQDDDEEENGEGETKPGDSKAEGEEK